MNIESECRSALKEIEDQIASWLENFARDALQPYAPLNHQPEDPANPYEHAPVTFLNIGMGLVPFDSIEEVLPQLTELLAQRRAWLTLLFKAITI